MRLILAAVLGGLVMFAWGAVSHMVLDLEKDTIKQVPNESAVVAAMKDNIREDGVYALPGIAMDKKPTDDEMNAWMAKYKEGPTARTCSRQSSLACNLAEIFWRRCLGASFYFLRR
jgi:hypothetical protein